MSVRWGWPLQQFWLQSDMNIIQIHLKTQWAAVMTQRSEMRAPPQEILFDRRLSFIIAACNNSSWISDSWASSNIWFFLWAICKTPPSMCVPLKIWEKKRTIHGCPPNWVSSPPTIRKLLAWTSPHSKKERIQLTGFDWWFIVKIMFILRKIIVNKGAEGKPREEMTYNRDRRGRRKGHCPSSSLSYWEEITLWDDV